MTDKQNNYDMNHLSLGKTTEYVSHYTPSLLQAVPRSVNRSTIAVGETLPFFGCDVWNGYELSWLNSKGKPVVALLRCTVPCESPNLIESKSFKLYLNSFNQTRFDNLQQVETSLRKDLSNTAEREVNVELFSPQQWEKYAATSLPGLCIDELDIEVSEYTIDPSLLFHKSNLKQAVIREILHSHLLKSNCLITNQPDWASIIIDYQGSAICHESLLKYLVSFRMHNEFHEQCVERIYTDLMAAFDFEKLSVQALYTRRGGLDINPFRASEGGAVPPLLRVNRQ